MKPRIVFNNECGEGIAEVRSNVIPQIGNYVIIADPKKHDRRYKVYNVEIVYVFDDETIIYVTVI